MSGEPDFELRRVSLYVLDNDTRVFDLIRGAVVSTQNNEPIFLCIMDLPSGWSGLVDSRYLFATLDRAIRCSYDAVLRKP